MFCIVATGTFLLFCTIGASDISTPTTTSSDSSENLIIPAETLDSTIQPSINSHKSPNVSASVGRTAMLKCTISNLGQKSVSWVRHNDVNLISVGKYKYIKDKRIRILHESNEWVLIITDVQFSDKGLYECQVNSLPRVSHVLSLNVVEPYTEILGGSKDVFINLHSAVNLTCMIYSPEEPAHIFWSHNGKPVYWSETKDPDLNEERYIIQRPRLSEDSFSISSLILQTARSSDSGRYECNPSNTAPASIYIHVLNGESPDALQTSGLSTFSMSPFTVHLIYFNVIVLLFSNVFNIVVS